MKIRYQSVAISHVGSRDEARALDFLAKPFTANSPASRAKSGQIVAVLTGELAAIHDLVVQKENNLTPESGAR
jgi:hypothetical protein